MNKPNISLKCILAFLVLTFSTLTIQAAGYPAGSPVAINGKLKVSGTQMVNECGYPIQLRGMSTHGPQWYGNCICTESLNAMVDQWGIDVFRLAMYVREQGYTTNPGKWREWIDDWVKECGDRGIYCLIDWHVLNPGDPNATINDAKEFWDYMSKTHGSKKHVLFEICNEPNGVDWSTVKKYADQIVNVIRNNDKETIIIVGTPTWSQDVDKAAENPIQSNNIMYTLHFYAGSHKEYLRNKATAALNGVNGKPGIALFVTECGTSHASGDKDYSPDETKTWISYLNERKISWINWSYADKGEVSAALVPGSCNSRNWNNTTASGTLIRELIKANRPAYQTCNGQSSGNQGGQDQGGQQQGGQQQGGQDQGGQQQGGQQQGGQQQGGQQQGGQQGGNQGGQTIEPAAQCPELANEIHDKFVYRIVNKSSCKVMAVESDQEKAKLVQATRNDQEDKKQMFQLRKEGDYYIIRNLTGSKVLSNQYNPNDGADIVQQNLSEYDNPTEKWAISSAGGQWFKITNKQTTSGVIGLKSSSNSDGTSIVQKTSNNNGDESLWGFEYINEGTGESDIMNADLILVPTIVEDEFEIIGEDEYTDLRIVSYSSLLVKDFEKQAKYNISDLIPGVYFVIVYNNNVPVKHFKVLKK